MKRPTHALTFALAALISTNAALTTTARAASGCEDLSSVPINFGPIGYDSADDGIRQIQEIFDDWCVSCHVGDFPPADLNLSPGFSADFIVEVSSTEVPLPRVAPANPRISYLFQKINCTQPDVGDRMPAVGSPLTLEDQALIFDWIQAGVMPNSDYIFRGSNESTRF